jgi:hypothetical protein
MVKFIGGAVLGSRTKSLSLDGGPIFAPAYMGRKRRNGL